MKKYCMLLWCIAVFAQANPWEHEKYDGFRYQLPGNKCVMHVEEGSELSEKTPIITGRPVNAEKDIDFIAGLFAHKKGAKFWEDGPVVLEDEGVVAHIKKRLERYEARGKENLLSWWVFFLEDKPCGFVGGHRYLDCGDEKPKAVEDQGLIEVCYFMDEPFWGYRIDSRAKLSDVIFRSYVLSHLGEQGLQGRYKKVYAPINPATDHSIEFAKRQGFQKTSELTDKSRHVYSISHDALSAKMEDWSKEINIVWSAA